MFVMAYETTKRLKQCVSQIYKYAITNSIADTNPSHYIQDALKTKKGGESEITSFTIGCVVFG